MTRTMFYVEFDDERFFLGDAIKVATVDGGLRAGVLYGVTHKGFFLKTKAMGKNTYFEHKNVAQIGRVI